jgi:hypothetical protein
MSASPLFAIDSAARCCVLVKCMLAALLTLTVRLLPPALPSKPRIISPLSRLSLSSPAPRLNVG